MKRYPRKLLMVKYSLSIRSYQCRIRDPNCIVEQTKDCSKTGILYEITCLTCNAKVDSPSVSRSPGQCKAPNYVGMTRTSAHQRMSNHLQGQRSKSTNNPLHRHDCNDHNGEVQMYRMRILRAETNLVPLAVSEGLYIEQQFPGSSFNDKNEYGRGSIVRLTGSR